MNTFEYFDHEPQVKDVKKLADGSISFPVTHQTAIGPIEFDLRLKKDSNGKVLISNQTKITEGNKWYILNKDAIFTLSTESRKSFSQSLGQALDAYIGKGRRSVAPQKREKAYKLLGYKESSHEIQEQTELAKTKSDLQALQNELPKKFSRDKKDKILNVEYNIGYGANEKIMYTSFQQVGDKVKFTLSSGYLWTLAGLENKEITFSKNKLEEQVEAFLIETLSKPLTYKKLLGKDTEYTMREQVKQNAIKKAKDAARIFLKYNQQKNSG